jgi:hypothetical protein
MKNSSDGRGSGESMGKGQKGRFDGGMGYLGKVGCCRGVVVGAR